MFHFNSINYNQRISRSIQLAPDVGKTKAEKRKEDDEEQQMRREEKEKEEAKERFATIGTQEMILICDKYGKTIALDISIWLLLSNC